MSTTPASERVAAVEGFRGVAVLLVVAFHYLFDLGAHEASAAYYPFGNRFAHPLLGYGKTGVQFFFIISGFVIALTLERCSNWREFAVKRAARLMPGMVLCSIITFGVLSVVPQKIWEVKLIDMLPSLTMIGETPWSWLLGVPVGVVDGVYWSLFVEVQFYLLAATLYFGARRIPLMWSLTGVLLAMWCLSRSPLQTYWPIGYTLLKSMTVYDSLPFFLAGVAFHCVASHRHVRSATGVIALSALLTIVRNLKSDPAILFFYGTYFALFAVLVTRPSLLRAFEWRPLLVVGAASYTIYLLHNRIGVSLTHNLAPSLPVPLAQSLFLPACMLTLCVGTAWLIDRYWDAPLRKWIVRKFCKPTGAARVSPPVTASSP
ncbi:acyltransferase family protein [Sphaerotilaceae bacterium SBD11-9]